ncbi:MAG TPA: MDR family MFS transporter [Bacilli bacterium]|nr:MDR family MFS transporter [Bacilli bacterium]
MEDKRKRTFVITGLLLGLFFSSLDQTVVGTAMPTIVGKLGNIELLTWITTAYLLSSTTVVPIAGKLADLFGRRTLYMLGMAIFILGSALCGMADSMMQLTIFRGIQGIGGGMLMPLALTIIGDITTGESRAKMQGLFMSVFGLSSIIGPPAGGWIVDHWSWEWIFYINLPFGVIAAIFIAIGLKGDHVKKKVVIDWGGIFTLIIGVVSLLLALSLGGREYEWNSGQIIALFLAAVVGLLSFVLIELRAKDPILSMSFFKNRTFTIINLIGFLMSLGMFGAITFIPFLMQGVVGLSATQASTVMTPMMIGSIAASLIGSRLLTKVSVRPMLITGLLVMTLGFVLFAQLGEDASRTIASIDMVVLGIGMGLIMPLLSIVVQEAFPAEVRGTVTSATAFFRSIGGTVGIALLGAVFNSKSAQGIGTKLDAIFTGFGEQGKHMIDLAHNNPQGLFASLFNAETLKQMPDAVRPIFEQQVIPVLKTSMLGALHTVFHTGIIFTLAGILIALFIGKLRVTGMMGKKQEAATKEAATQEAAPQP